MRHCKVEVLDLPSPTTTATSAADILHVEGVGSCHKHHPHHHHQRWRRQEFMQTSCKLEMVERTTAAATATTSAEVLQVCAGGSKLAKSTRSPWNWPPSHTCCCWSLLQHFSGQGPLQVGGGGVNTNLQDVCVWCGCRATLHVLQHGEPYRHVGEMFLKI